MTDLTWRTACLDWRERLVAGRSLVPELPLFRAEADRALAVFKRLRIPDVEGMPTNGEAAGPWLFPLVESIFGAYDVATGRQMISEYDLVVPKKNSKTSSASSIALTAMLVNRRPNAEGVLIGPEKVVADRNLQQAIGSIQADSDLKRMFHIQEHARKITLRPIEGRTVKCTLQILAADTSAVTGGKQKFTIVDELHEMAANPKAAAIMTEIFGAQAARPDGWTLIITTQSKEPPRGVFKAMLERARDVRDGKLSLPLLPVLYELPEDRRDAWRDEANWPLVNPNLNRSVSIAYLRTALAKAEGSGAAAKEELALLASQHFNVEIGAAQRADRWAGADFWQAATDEALTLDALLARSEVACIGIDGGGLDDLFGVAVLGRDRVTKEWLAWGRAFGHRIILAKRKSEATLLEGFEQDGDLVFDGDASLFVPKRRAADADGPPPTPFDIAGVLDVVAKVDAAGILHKVGLDPAGVGGVVDALAGIGVGSAEDEASFGYARVVGVPQGFALMRGIKTVERKLRDGTLWVAAQPLMAWCVSNARTEYKANYVQVTKAASGVGKIDPLMALFDAAFLMSDNPEAMDGATSIYDRPELWAAAPNVG